MKGRFLFFLHQIHEKRIVKKRQVQKGKGKEPKQQLTDIIETTKNITFYRFNCKYLIRNQDIFNYDVDEHEHILGIP